MLGQRQAERTVDFCRRRLSALALRSRRRRLGSTANQVHRRTAGRGSYGRVWLWRQYLRLVRRRLEWARLVHRRIGACTRPRLWRPRRLAWLAPSRQSSARSRRRASPQGRTSGRRWSSWWRSFASWRRPSRRTSRWRSPGRRPSETASAPTEKTPLNAKRPGTDLGRRYGLRARMVVRLAQSPLHRAIAIDCLEARLIHAGAREPLFGGGVIRGHVR